MKYLNFSVAQSLIGFIIKQASHIIELVPGWFPGGTFRKNYTSFLSDYEYEKDLISANILMSDALQKST